MTLELTHDQAVVYLHDLADVLNGIAVALLAAGQIVRHTPSARVPEGMLCSLVSSWESLDSHFQAVYTATYGHPTNDNDEAYSAGTEACVGPPAVQ